MKKKKALSFSGTDNPSMYSVSIAKKASVPENVFGIILKRFFGDSGPVADNSKYIKYGFYTRDVAETKIKEISDFVVSNKQEFRLKCAVEKQISDVDQN